MRIRQGLNEMWAGSGGRNLKGISGAPQVDRTKSSTIDTSTFHIPVTWPLVYFQLTSFLSVPLDLNSLTLRVELVRDRYTSL